MPRWKARYCSRVIGGFAALQHLARAGGAVAEQVDRHRGQGLGGAEVGELLVDDLVVGAVAGAGGAAHVGMEDRHDHAEVAHVGRAGAVADLPVVLLADELGGVVAG